MVTIAWEERVESCQGDLNGRSLPGDDERLEALDLIEAGVYEPPCRFARDERLAYG